MKSKKIRDHIQLERQKLSAEAQQQAATSLAHQALKNESICLAKHLGIYLAHRGEVSLSVLITQLLEQGKNLYAPVLHPTRPGFLWFAPYTPHTKLCLNPYAIQEPSWRAQEILAPWELDVVLVPLIAVDIHGNRLGSGKGYYDRSFQYLPWLPKPRLIGCAYEFQVLQKLPRNPWDIPVTELISVK